MLTRILKAQRGFTLIELMAVIAILTVLAGLVAGAVTGIGASGQSARLVADANTMGGSADRFFNDAFPQSYPVLTCCDDPLTTSVNESATSKDITVAGDLGVRLIDFEAVLPGNPTKKFAPDFLKEVPNTAALVSWRILTATGQVFFAQDGSQLVRPSAARLDVSALDSTMSTPATTPATGSATAAVPVISNHTFKLRMNKNEAALQILGIAIPAKYSIGGQSTEAGSLTGTLTGTVSTDNPWTPGVVVSFSGELRATGSPNEWTLTVDYPTTVTGASSTVGARADRALVSGVDTRHKVSIATPSEETAGAIKIQLNTTGDKAHNQGTETWTLTICGRAGTPSATTCPTTGGTVVITNPSVKGVYRWLGTQHSTIDVTDLFSSMAGNQAVIIK